MTITNPATAKLRAPGAPVHAADIDINGAIVRYIAKRGPCGLNAVMEVFAPAPAAGCNLDDQRALIHRLQFLVITGRLLRTKGPRERYHCIDREALDEAQSQSTNH